MNMNMIKKLILAALLVPSSMVVASQPPVLPVQPETIMGNFGASVAGYQNFLVKSTLALSRFTLSASKTASDIGDYFADHHLVFGSLATATMLGLGYLYFFQRTAMKKIYSDGKKKFFKFKQD
jgi:hypothetical protein